MPRATLSGPGSSGTQTITGSVEATIAGGSIAVNGSFPTGSYSLDPPITIGAEVDVSGTTYEQGTLQYLRLDQERDLCVRPKSYDPSTDAEKTIPVWSSVDSYEFFDHSSSADDAAGNGAVSTYFSMEGFGHFSLQYITADATGAQDLKIYSTNQNDGTAASSCVYLDVTNAWFSTGSFITSSWIEPDVTVTCKHVRITNTISGLNDGDTATWTIYGMKKSV